VLLLSKSSHNGHLLFVLVSTERVIVCLAADNSASCKIRATVRFLHGKDLRAEEIQYKLCVRGVWPNVKTLGFTLGGKNAFLVEQSV
jgi:hypothetical protein